MKGQADRARAERIDILLAELDNPLFIPPNDDRILKFSPVRGLGLLLHDEATLFSDSEIDVPDYLELEVADPVDVLRGFERLYSTKDLPFALFSRLEGLEVVEGEGILDEVLEVPREGDVEFMKYMAGKADEAMRESYREIHVGMSDLEIKSEIVCQAARRGLEADLRISIQGKGGKVEKGDLVVVEAVFRSEGYWIPYVRTFLTGRDFEVENKLGIVVGSLKEALSLVSPGYPSLEVRDSLVNYLAKYGLPPIPDPVGPVAGFSGPKFERYEVLKRNQIFRMVSAAPSRKGTVAWSVTALTEIPVAILDGFGNLGS